MKECPKELIDAHWGYIEGVLKAHEVCTEVIPIAEFHYKAAFAHGWKHAKEEGEQCIAAEKEPFRNCTTCKFDFDHAARSVSSADMCFICGSYSHWHPK